MPAPARAKTAYWAPRDPKIRPFRYGDAPDVRVDAPLAPGTIVAARYRIDRLIGEGGMGRVYSAQHCTLGHWVALKLLRRDKAHPDRAARLRQEAKAASRVGHRAIVEVIDFDTTPEGVVYMAMERLQGESYESWLERGGSMAEGVRWLAEVARGLHAAHSAGIVHRDVKPDNVFLHRGADGVVQPKLLDFGLAKATTADMTQVETQAGTLLGTPYYIAPERALGRPLDPRADLYSLGVMLYETLTGNVPFVDESFMEILARHIKTPPLDPRQAAPDRDLPDALCLVAMRLLAKDPGDRPRSGAEVADLLMHVLATHGAALANTATGPREVSGAAQATTDLDAVACRPTTAPASASTSAPVMTPRSTAIDGSSGRPVLVRRAGSTLVGSDGSGPISSSVSRAALSTGLRSSPMRARGGRRWTIALGALLAVATGGAVARTLGSPGDASEPAGDRGGVQPAHRPPGTPVDRPTILETPATPPPANPAVVEAVRARRVPTPSPDPSPAAAAAVERAGVVEVGGKDAVAGDINAGTSAKSRRSGAAKTGKRRDNNRRRRKATDGPSPSSRDSASPSDDPAKTSAELPEFKDVF